MLADHVSELLDPADMPDQRPPRDKSKPNSIDEGTDAYDTIDWLIKNVPIDRNPQKFVDNIYKASDADYVKATQKIYRSKDAASSIALPVMAR